MFLVGYFLFAAICVICALVTEDVSQFVGKRFEILRNTFNIPKQEAIRRERSVAFHPRLPFVSRRVIRAAQPGWQVQGSRGLSGGRLGSFAPWGILAWRVPSVIGHRKF